MGQTVLSLHGTVPGRGLRMLRGGSDSLWRLLSEQEVILGDPGKYSVWLQSLGWKRANQHPQGSHKIAFIPFVPITDGWKYQQRFTQPGAAVPWVQLLLSPGVPGLVLSCPCHPQVVQRIKAVETETRLLVVDKETDEYLCSLRLTCTEDMVHNGILLSSSVPPAKAPASDNGELWKPQLDVSGGSLQRHSHSFSSHGSRKVRALGALGSGWDALGSLSSLSTACPVREKPSVCGCHLGDPACPRVPFGISLQAALAVGGCAFPALRCPLRVS